LSGHKLLCCGRCHLTFYCSKTCQLEDWRNGHKSSCKLATKTNKP
jgi:hypothetical protein